MDSTPARDRHGKRHGSQPSIGNIELKVSGAVSARCEIIIQSFKEQSTFDVIFVHGLTQTSEHTWCNQDKSKFWLTELFPLDTNSSIITCGLNLIEIAAKNVPLIELSTSLFTQLQKVRRDKYALATFEERSVIFVCHSLGGLLVRCALTQEAFSGLRGITKGLVFFGTPNYDSPSKWIDFVKNVEQAKNSTRSKEFDISNSALPQELVDTNVAFYECLEENQISRQDICCFYETGAVFEIGIIAPKSVACIPNCTQLPQQADHMGLARFEFAYDPAYQLFLEQIKLLETSQTTSSADKYKWEEPIELPQHRKPDITRPQTPLPSFLESSPMPDGREIILTDSNELTQPAKQICLLALAHEDRGRYERADELYRQAYEIYCATTEAKQRHPFSIFCRDKQGSVKRDQGEYEAAEEIGKEVFQLQLEADHEHLLRGSGNLARTLRFRGKYIEAFHTIKRALMETDKCPLHTIPGAAAVSILAKTLKDLGKYKFAEHLSRDVARACYVLLGPLHPFTLNRESDLAVVIAKRGRYETAANVSGKALDGLEKVLDPDHPLALRTAKRHATYLRFCGEFKKAEAILKRTLSAQMKQLNEEHPDVLSTKSSLASVYVLLEKPEKALKIFEKVFQVRESNFKRLQSKCEFDKTSQPDPIQPDLQWTREALERTKRIVASDYSNSRSTLEERFMDFFKTPTLHKAAKDAGPDYDKLELHPIIDSPEEEEALAVIEQPEKVWDPNILGKAIRIAAGKGDEVAVKKLYNMGADINSTGGYFGNALQAASYFGRADLVTFLLDKGAKSDQHRVGLFGFALRAAALGNHAQVASILLESKGEMEAKALADATDEVLGTSLEAAMAGFHDSVVQVLLNKGANPNAQDPSLGTPLQQASWAGNKELVRMLLDRGANPTLTSGAIDSPLKLAASKDKEAHHEIIKLLLHYGAASKGNSFAEALDTAILLGHVENLKILLSKGSDGRIRTYIDALQIAGRMGRFDIVDIILRHEPTPGRGSVGKNWPSISLLLPPLSVKEAPPYQQSDHWVQGPRPAFTNDYLDPSSNRYDAGPSVLEPIQPFHSGTSPGSLSAGQRSKSQPSLPVKDDPESHNNPIERL